jgi:hypothetical protein
MAVMESRFLCWFCEKARGKRACPAGDGRTICSRCCGTQRRVEIACPNDCPYLHGEHDPRWESQAREQERALFYASFAGMNERQATLLANLHILLLNAWADLGGKLTDGEALELVSTLLQTWETRSKGVLYEHSSESLGLHGITRELTRELSERSWAPEASDGEVLEALRTLHAALGRHLESHAGKRSYLALADREMPRNKRPESGVNVPSGAPLIVKP